MSDQSRRKLLKSMVAGSGAIVAGKSLPENWSKPVVDSVILPAHAQTSQQTSQCTPIGSASAGPVDLPDLVNVDIDIPTSGSGIHTLTQVTVDLDITHTWIGDLDVTLTSPEGTTSPMFNDVCDGPASVGMNITLDDTAGNAVGSNCAAPYTGTYNTGGGLDAFIGEDPNGTWTLNVIDDFGGDSGTLNNVTLNIASTCV